MKWDYEELGCDLSCQWSTAMRKVLIVLLAALRSLVSHCDPFWAVTNTDTSLLRHQATTAITQLIISALKYTVNSNTPSPFTQLAYFHRVSPFPTQSRTDLMLLTTPSDELLTIVLVLWDRFYMERLSNQYNLRNHDFILLNKTNLLTDNSFIICMLYKNCY